MPIADPTKINCVQIKTTLETMHTDLQASMRAVLVAADELHDISFVRNANSNQVVIVYTYEDLSP